MILISLQYTNLESFIFSIFILIPCVIIASTVHEYAHALTAYKLGDWTAKSMGRLSLNPLSHIDPYGLAVMVLSGGRIGWSKPVPINEGNYNVNPMLGTSLVAIAGPISNLILAAIFGIIYRIIFTTITTDIQLIASTIILLFIIVNLSLTLFNLIPIPPLDGSRLVRAILPENLKRYWEDFERYMPFVLIFILFLPGSPVSSILGIALNFMLMLFTGVSYY